MDKNIELLTKYIRKEDVALFIGSGFSLKAGAPSVKQIIDAILKEGGELFSNSLTDKDDLSKVSQAFVDHCGSRNDLLCVLNDLFSFKPGDVSDQLLIQKIPHIRTIFTTNYDTLIENAYPQTDRNVITSNTGRAYAQEGKVNIYKVHGDMTSLNNTDSIVITENDYKRYFSSHRFDSIWEELKRTFQQKHVVFIGYSLKDDNILDILKKVRATLKENLKSVFLVAPYMSDQDQKRLFKNNVFYIDSTGGDLLNNVLISLKENIAKDYKHKKVSQETFEKFLDINGDIYTTSTHLHDKNRIDKIQVKKGCKKHEELQFGVIDPSIKTAIENLEFNDKFPIKGTNLTVPVYRIDADKMQNFCHKINGITVMDKDELSLLYVTPCFETPYITLRMKSIGLKEKFMAIRRRERNTIITEVDLPICVMQWKVTILANEYKFDISFDLKENYSDNNKARTWIDFIIGVFSGKTFYINELKLEFDKRNHDGVNYYKKVKQYYETIFRIERDLDIEFQIYNNYTDKNLHNALCLYNYHMDTGFMEEMHGIPTLTFDLDTSIESGLPIKDIEKHVYFSIECREFGEFKLNDKTFQIPFISILHKNCVVKSVTPINDHVFNIVMEDKDNECQVWCSDKQPEQVGQVIHLGNKCAS